MKYYSIAIDGPSGAGKSTLAKALSARLGYLYVDTGAIYRTIGLYAYRNGIDPKDGKKVSAVLPGLDIRMSYGDDGLQHMFLNGEDVSTGIRQPAISMYASAVSAIPEVRSFLLEMQRSTARNNSVIMDGRDIGTVVLPDADVKIFLTADVTVRALRRVKELEQRGTPTPYEEVLEDMKKRDYADSHREIAPLAKADDAVAVDTSNLNFDQSLDVLMGIIHERTSK